MSSWGHRQQMKIIIVAVIIAAILVGAGLYFGFFNNPPTCSDNKQNGDENGIDCGGSCQKICLADQLDPIVQYTRTFQVTAGFYSALAIVENPNPTLLAENVPYTFKVLDKNGVLIAERHGLVFIPPHKIFPIFEGTLKTGIRVPARLAFEFDQPPVWRRAEAAEPVLTIVDQNLSTSASSSRLDVMLENSNPYDFKNIKVTALLYDDTNNVFAASETIIDDLSRRTKAPLVFTWPTEFTPPPTKIEIISSIPYQNFIPIKK